MDVHHVGAQVVQRRDPRRFGTRLVQLGEGPLGAGLQPRDDRRVEQLVDRRVPTAPDMPPRRRHEGIVAARTEEVDVMALSRLRLGEVLRVGD